MGGAATAVVTARTLARAVRVMGRGGAQATGTAGAESGTGTPGSVMTSATTPTLHHPALRRPRATPHAGRRRQLRRIAAKSKMGESGWRRTRNLQAREGPVEDSKFPRRLAVHMGNRTSPRCLLPRTLIPVLSASRMNTSLLDARKPSVSVATN